MEKEVEFFHVQVEPLSVRFCRPLLYQYEKNELFLGAHCRLCGFGSVAHIDSEDLAKQYAAACVSVLEKRYGTRVSLKVTSWRSRVGSASSLNRLCAKIVADSDIIRMRLATANFVPNRWPVKK